MKRKYLPAILALVLVSCLTARDGGASDKQKDDPSIFRVPTTGTIVDVTYTPEFDEWWVKCREGNNLAVYSYDRTAGSWAKVLFIPTKPGKKPPEPAQVKKKAPEAEKPEKKAPLDEAVPAPEAVKKPAPEVKPDAEDTQPPPKPKEKKKWWNPLNILKKGEQLLRPEPESVRKIRSGEGQEKKDPEL